MGVSALWSNLLNANITFCILKNWTHTHITLSNWLLIDKLFETEPICLLFRSDTPSYSAHSSIQCPEFYTDELIFWFKMTRHMLSNFVKHYFVVSYNIQGARACYVKIPKRSAKGSDYWIDHLKTRLHFFKLVQKSTNYSTSIDFWISEYWACIIPTIFILIWGP